MSFDQIKYVIVEEYVPKNRREREYKARRQCSPGDILTAGMWATY